MLTIEKSTEQDGCQWREHVDENSRAVSDLEIIRRRLVKLRRRNQGFSFSRLGMRSRSRQRRQRKIN